jgi:hypothetical protein
VILVAVVDDHGNLLWFSRCPCLEASHTHIGSELLELFGPVVKDAERANDQEWLERALAEEGVEGDSL